MRTASVGAAACAATIRAVFFFAGERRRCCSRAARGSGSGSGGWLGRLLPTDRLMRLLLLLPVTAAGAAARAGGASSGSPSASGPETTAAMANSALSISALAGLGGLRCSVVRMCTVRSLGATHGSIATLLPRTAVGGSSASSPTLVAVRRLVRRRASSAASAARASGTTLDQRTTLVVEEDAAAEPPSRGGCGRASTANGMGRAGVTVDRAERPAVPSRLDWCGWSPWRANRRAAPRVAPASGSVGEQVSRFRLRMRQGQYPCRGLGLPTCSKPVSGHVRARRRQLARLDAPFVVRPAYVILTSFFETERRLSEAAAALPAPHDFASAVSLPLSCTGDPFLRQACLTNPCSRRCVRSPRARAPDDADHPV